ncbi:MAG: arginyltransferase [Magnetococcales bacterium]|nr:arginyltransferase [Magnetococcales bacterium]NGZ25613.1 arginyltransferase [Magnetococcales bacterium]
MQTIYERLEKARFSISTPHECGYLPGSLSVTLMADPKLPWSSAIYQHFLEYGFRRSGSLVYRPYCPLCRACIPVRIPVNRFSYDRAMRRCWRHNQDLQVTMVSAQYSEERFNLYSRYITSRHGDGPMANPTVEGFCDFLLFPKIDVVFYEFRRQGRLVMVAVTDILPNSLSAVYTFFDPDEHKASLGTYGILWQVTEAVRLRKSHLYLGYYIQHCQKMSYKIRFHPLEALSENGWSTTIPHYEPDSLLLDELEEEEGLLDDP